MKPQNQRRKYAPAKINLPDLGSQIDPQSMNLIPFRDWEPMVEWTHDLASCPTGDRHWLNCARHHGFKRAIESVRLYAAIPGLNQSRHVMTFWAIYTGGANLPGTKTLFCRPDPDPKPADRQEWLDEINRLWEQLEVESFPCIFQTSKSSSGDYEYVSFEHLLHTFRTRFAAVKSYPGHMPAECLAFIRLLCASPIQYPKP